MRKYTLRVVLVAAAMAGCFLLLSSWTKTEKAAPCEESMDQSCSQEEKHGPNNTILESFSGQFFSSSNIN